jgi:hypothetical protein
MNPIMEEIAYPDVNYQQHEAGGFLAEKDHEEAAQYLRIADYAQNPNRCPARTHYTLHRDIIGLGSLEGTACRILPTT